MEGNLMCYRIKDTSTTKYNWKEFYQSYYLQKQERLARKTMLAVLAINLTLGGILLWLIS
jgi:hypothetical protein